MKKKNSLDAIIVDVYEGLFKDLSRLYPSIDLSRDWDRLVSGVKERGRGFYAIDLPSLDKILLSGLENQFLTTSGPMSHRVSKKCRLPRFLSGVWKLVFLNDGRLKPNPDQDAILFLRQIFCLGKKLVSKCSDRIVKDSIDEFFILDSDLRPIELSWFDYEERTNPARLSFDDGIVSNLGCLHNDDGNQLIADIRRLATVCDNVACTLGYYDPYEYSQSGAFGRFSDSSVGPLGFKHGPGAVADIRSGTSKYRFPSWPTWLQDYFPFDAFGDHAFSVSQMPDGDDISPSRIIDVPKTMDKPRLIAAEPACNQWTQQITRSWIDERMSMTWLGKFIDLHDQGKSQEMVKKASLTGELATVDLSSASDRLSAWCVVRMFRKNHSVFRALRAHRTIYTSHCSRNEPVLINKFATQGTAVTFPVQSLFFLACALAVSIDGKVTRKKINSLIGKVRTFGDDIILPSSRYSRLENLLSFLELKVNDQKSFKLGKFRESCGMDCYDGIDVTPVKPKLLVASGPESELSVLDTVNNLFLKGFWCASEALRSSQLSGRLRLPVKSVDSGTFGFVSFCGGNVAHLPFRYNYDFHQLEVRAHTFVSCSPKHKTNDRSQVFQFFTERPSLDQKWSSGVPMRSKLQRKLKWVLA